VVFCCVMCEITIGCQLNVCVIILGCELRCDV